MTQLLLKPEKVRWYQSPKFKKSLKESLWVSASWNWFTTLISTFGELVLTGSVLYTTAMLTPGISRPAPWIDNSVTLAQQLTLDISGLVMVKQWLKLKKAGHEEQSKYAKVTAICLISIMFAALVLAVTSSHYTYNKDLLVALEILLLLARGAAAILYGVMLLVIHFISEDPKETPQEVAKVAVLETKITELHQKIDTFLAAPQPQVVPQVLIENHLQTAIMNGPLAELLAEIRTGHKTLADQIAEMKRQNTGSELYVVTEVLQPEAPDRKHRTGSTGPEAPDRKHRTGSTGPEVTSTGPEAPDRKYRTGSTGPEVTSTGPDRKHRTGSTGPEAPDRKHRTGSSTFVPEVLGTSTEKTSYITPDIPNDVGKMSFVLAFLIANSGLYDRDKILSAASARGLSLPSSTLGDARKKYIADYNRPIVFVEASEAPDRK